MSDYIGILKDAGIVPSQQRLKILQFLDGNRNHPTADNIYQALRDELPTLSKTTVYNTIQSLREHGLLNVVNMGLHEARFDSVINPHHHLLCSECGRIIDIDIQCPYTRKALAGGHRIDEVHGYFKGVCEACLKRGTNDG